MGGAYGSQSIKHVASHAHNLYQSLASILFNLAFRMSLVPKVTDPSPLPMDNPPNTEVANPEKKIHLVPKDLSSLANIVIERFRENPLVVPLQVPKEKGKH